MPDGPGLIAYTEILEQILIPPPSIVAQARVIEKGKSHGSGRSGIDVDRSKAPHHGAKSEKDNAAHAGTSASGKKLPVKGDKASHVSILLNVVRKSLHSFICTDDTQESAWMCLLNAFRRFDPTESGTVSPREFCLAVSVLLGGDEILLSEAAWIEIIEAFTVKDDKKGKTGSSRRAAGSSAADKVSKVQVDYMEFGGLVLDPKAVKEAELAFVKDRAAGAASTSSVKKGVATEGSSSRERARKRQEVD